MIEQRKGPHGTCYELARGDIALWYDNCVCIRTRPQAPVLLSDEEAGELAELICQIIDPPRTLRASAGDPDAGGARARPEQPRVYSISGGDIIVRTDRGISVKTVGADPIDISDDEAAGLAETLFLAMTPPRQATVSKDPAEILIVRRSKDGN